MALTIRKIDTSVAFAAAAALNLQRKAIVDDLTSYPHYDATATTDRKSTRLNSSHSDRSRMPSSA